jgi:hypothetical protein
MLPKKNPYEIIKVWSMYPTEIYSKNPTWKGDKTKPMLLDYGISLQQHPDYTIRDVWTVIDSLTWLEEQSYIIEVLKSVYENSFWEISIINNNDNTHFDINENIIYNSRIEAYTEGIKHCLNLIKDELNRTIKTNS